MSGAVRLVTKGRSPGHVCGNSDAGTATQVDVEFSRMACSRRTPTLVPFCNTGTKYFSKGKVSSYQTNVPLSMLTASEMDVQCLGHR